jgi:hypothetical protein
MLFSFFFLTSYCSSYTCCFRETHPRQKNLLLQDKASFPCIRSCSFNHAVQKWLCFSLAWRHVFIPCVLKFVCLCTEHPIVNISLADILELLDVWFASCEGSSDVALGIRWYVRDYTCYMSAISNWYTRYQHPGPIHSAKWKLVNDNLCQSIISCAVKDGWTDLSTKGYKQNWHSNHNRGSMNGQISREDYR